MVKTFGVCDFSRLAVTDWRLRRWRLCFLALMTATHIIRSDYSHAAPFIIYIRLVSVRLSLPCINMGMQKN